MANSAVRPLISRPLDLAWSIWFALHLIVMFCVDLFPLYPSWLQPELLHSLRKWYIATYHDRFFVSPPAWFQAYIYLEAAYHVPLSIWAVGALRRDDPLVPLHLLIWALQTVITTGTCIIDYMYWTGITTSEVNALHGNYIPYLALSSFMGIDMFTRLHRQLLAQRTKLD